MRFEDYHRTVIGYHGTKRSIAEQIVLGNQPFGWSGNDDDWLGHGVYFWEHAPQQAWWWAKRRSVQQKWGEEPAVLGAMIRLGACFDLLDPFNLQQLERFHQEYVKACAAANLPIRENANNHKYLDCETFKFSYAAFENEGVKVDSCRAVFVPTGKRAWTRSGIYRQAHIQICVRNLKRILGTWLVSPVEEDHAEAPQQPANVTSNQEDGEEGGSDDA